jgi:hypothetical protein
VSATHREYTNIQGNFAERKSDLYAKAKPAMDKPEALKGVIAEIQKYNLDAAKYKGAIPLINSTALKRAVISGLEKKFVVFEDDFGPAVANP